AGAQRDRRDPGDSITGDRWARGPEVRSGAGDHAGGSDRGLTRDEAWRRAEPRRLLWLRGYRPVGWLLPRSARSARLQRIVPRGLLQYRTAGTRAPAASSALTVRARDVHQALPERRHTV